MPNNLDTYSVLGSATGDQPSEQTVIRTVNFDRYAIELELTADGKYVSIVSIKVQKSFIEGMASRQISDVHDVEEYYSEE